MSFRKRSKGVLGFIKPRVSFDQSLVFSHQPSMMSNQQAPRPWSQFQHPDYPQQYQPLQQKQEDWHWSAQDPGQRNSGSHLSALPQYDDKWIRIFGKDAGITFTFGAFNIMTIAGTVVLGQ
jgi:hypothetical protein